jgi:NAD(P)-dependent dehydrogenase (short-subunit alcohol dehydrogenase family)
VPDSHAPLVVVTGGSRGIGRAIVEKALAAGFRVVAVDVDAVGLSELSDGTSPSVSERLGTAVLDITDTHAVDEWVEALVRDEGAPSALVNNAGIVRGAALEDLDIADWRAVLDVNLTGTFVMTQRVGRRMIAAGGGSIVGIGSIASFAWTVGGGSYPPSKAAVAMLMRGAALEWGKYGIRANTVSPGYTETAMTAPIFANPATGEPRLARVPLGRVAQPSEIADVVVFLCSPQSSYLTGQNIAVDGGVTISPLLAPTFAGLPAATTLPAETGLPSSAG